MDFPLNCWRYHAEIEVEGSERRDLPDCLEAESLALWKFVDREDAYAQLSAGHWVIDGAFSAPYQAFAQDLATISLYLFKILRGVEVVERYVSEDQSDDARAWKVVARRGEWVKVPLVLTEKEDGRFVVNPDANDLAVIRARWADYPRWFHDGMRRQYLELRDL